MRKVSLAIAVILALWSCYGFAQDPPVPGKKTVPVQVQPPPVQGSGEASDSRSSMTDIHDIKPLVSVPVPISWRVVALWAAVCLAVGVLLWGAWFLRQRRRSPSVESIEAVLSPEETALQRLTDLCADTGIEGKLFYFQLSYIFREYLQGRFGIDGLEMTTEELLPHVEKLALDKELKRDAKRFIISCDPVKYASAPTLRESMARDYDFVKSFVEKTTASLDGPIETSDRTVTNLSE